MARGSKGTRAAVVRGHAGWLRRRNALTVEEVAQELGVTRRWVYRLIERGQLDALKVGRIWLVNKRSIGSVKKGKKEFH